MPTTQLRWIRQGENFACQLFSNCHGLNHVLEEKNSTNAAHQGYVPTDAAFLTSRLKRSGDDASPSVSLDPDMQEYNGKANVPGLHIHK